MPLRILIVVILTILIYTFNKKYNKRKVLALRGFLLTFLATLIPPLFFFVAPESIGTVKKVYITFLLAILVLLGLIINYFSGKKSGEKGEN